MKSTTILKQSARTASKIPAQPVMRTIAKGQMPSVSLNASAQASPQFTRPINPLGWNGACWHDGAD